MFRSKAIYLGSEANIKAESGDYYGAIELYSKAIDLCPDDYRFYLNRAFCYEKTELYHLSLVDSEEAIRLNRFIEKCYLRKARALVGLREYSKAEQTYQLVVQMNADSDEAKNDLIELRYRALRDMGFDNQTAMKGSTTYESIRSAIDGLLSQSINNCYNDFVTLNDTKERFENQCLINNFNNNSEPKNTLSLMDSNLITNCDKNGVNCNDLNNKCDNDLKGIRYADKVKNWSKAVPKKSKSVAKCETNVESKTCVKKLVKPTNIWGYNGIRVERVNIDNKKAIIEVFSAFGKVIGVEPVPNRKHSVWIYYDNSISPVEAIAATQSLIHPNLKISKEYSEPLRVYFAATNEQKELKFCRPKHPVNDRGECYYWRTTTCLMENCRLLHLPVNRHIDAQIWMKDTEGNAI